MTKTLPNVAGSFVANVSKINRDIKTIKKEHSIMTKTDSKTATDAKPTFA